MKIEVYTDGSATTADKPGGWAYVLIVDGKKEVECCGHMPNASNNDAEMRAAIEGLTTAFRIIMGHKEDPYEVHLVSDSQLVLGWANGTYRFKQADKIDIYNKLKALVSRMSVKTRWVRGHNGDEHNERCDRLANEARRGVESKKEREEAKERGETLIGTKRSGVACFWYKGVLKIVDFETNTIENYDKAVHGTRGSMFEIKEEKSR